MVGDEALNYSNRFQSPKSAITENDGYHTVEKGITNGSVPIHLYNISKFSTDQNHPRSRPISSKLIERVREGSRL